MKKDSLLLKMCKALSDYCGMKMFPMQWSLGKKVIVTIESEIVRWSKIENGNEVNLDFVQSARAFIEMMVDSNVSLKCWPIGKMTVLKISPSSLFGTSIAEAKIVLDYLDA